MTVSVRYEFGLLGPLEVHRDGAPVPIGAAKLRVLLASLLVDAGRVVTVDALVDRLWEANPPGGARNTLQNYVLRLRRALGPDGPDVVRTHSRGYLVEVGPDALDLRRFGTLVQRGRAALDSGAADHAAAQLREALELWRGEPLSDLPPDLFRDVVPALAERRLDALELRIDADLALGRPADVLPELRALIGAHPLRERFWAQRMRALSWCGRHGEALECYREVASLLADELGIDPGAELRDLHRRILAAALEPGVLPGQRERTTGNLPAETTTFVGREVQLAEVRRALEVSRLVTLTGVGGVGKTRLALRAAVEAGPAFPDGTWLADLAPLAARIAPEQLDRTVAESLGLRDHSARPPMDTVIDLLRDRRLLLVLDNCEHLVEAVATLASRLLRSAPGLRILATSRERLGMPGEHVLLVPSLTLPDERDAPGGDDCEAVRLLFDRAAAAAPAFGATGRGPVAQLCRRLDGLPLAIELAAVRLSSVTVEEILDRLDDRFRLLSGPQVRTGGRYQRTLRGVVDWSHGLCTEGERLSWERLSVFAGGFDLAAAEAVCAGEGVAREEVMDLLAGLVHKSIVVADGVEGRTRYRMLETIRQYGRERLRERGGAAALQFRLKHSDHYHDLTARAAAEWCGPDEVGWLLRLRRDLPDLRSALDACAGHPERAGRGLDIAVNLLRTRFWFFSGTLGEARHWLERLSAGPARSPSESAVTGAAMRAFLVMVQGDRCAVPAVMAECRAVAGPRPTAPALYVEGVHALLVRGDPASITLLAQARDAFRAASLTGDAHMATLFWAMAAAFLGHRDAALHARDVYVAEAEAAGAEWAGSWSRWCAGLVELRHGEPALALALLRDALVRQRAIGDDWGPVWDLEVMAWAAAAVGWHERAVELLGAAHRLRRSTGVAMTGLRPFHDARTEAERVIANVLTPEARAAAWKRGSTTPDGVALALRMTDEILGSSTL